MRSSLADHGISLHFSSLVFCLHCATPPVLVDWILAMLFFFLHISNYSQNFFVNGFGQNSLIQSWFFCGFGIIQCLWSNACRIWAYLHVGLWVFYFSKVSLWWLHKFYVFGSIICAIFFLAPLGPRFI